MRAPILLLMPCVLACDAGPVEWREAGAVATDTVDVAGAPAVMPGETAGRCDSTVRVVSAGDSGVVAVWWAAQADSNVRLLSARSTDGGRSWARAVPIDTVDVGARGCARPAPAVAFDPATEYVDVAYWLEAPEGPGVFFAHSMDAGAMYHAPVAIVFGGRPASTSVAAVGDTVVVAYEDPNSNPSRIALAISLTAGHNFQSNVVPASGSNAAAEAPSLALGGRTLTLRWREKSGGETIPMRRVGTLRAEWLAATAKALRAR